MIKLKELLSETSIPMGQVHSNPYAHSFKSSDEIKSVIEASTSVDLTIQRALEKDLKSAGIKVKSFKKDISVMGKRAPNSKTIVWGGVFKTKNAVIPISVASEGSVFYQDRHIGVLNKGSKVKDNFRSLKVSNKWVESVDEKVARPMSYRLRKAQDEIEYMIKQGPLDDEDVYDNSAQAMKLLQTAQKALGKIK